MIQGKDGTKYRKIKSNFQISDDVHKNRMKEMKTMTKRVGVGGALVGGGLGFARGGPVGAIGGAIQGGIAGSAVGFGVTKARHAGENRAVNKQAAKLGYNRDNRMKVDNNHTLTQHRAKGLYKSDTFKNYKAGEKMVPRKR